MPPFFPLPWQHLLTFSLQDGDVQSVEEAQARLSFLAQNKKLWSQRMFLDVGVEAILLRDVQSLVRTRACGSAGCLSPERPHQMFASPSLPPGRAGVLRLQIHLPLRRP